MTTSTPPLANLSGPAMKTPAAAAPEAKPLIVIVDDEEELAALVAEQLERGGMRTQVCHDAEHARRYLAKNSASLILLDVNLPGRSGFDLAREMRATGLNVPIIFVTGQIGEQSRVQGFELGGDDYVTKPFSYPELVARIRAVLRRSAGKEDLQVTNNVRVTDEPFDFCGAEVHPERLEIIFPGKPAAKLGRKELGILSYLHRHRAQVIPRKALIHAVWGVHADPKSRSLDQYVVKLRDLFASEGLALDGFRTVHGVGYVFDPERAAAAKR